MADNQNPQGNEQNPPSEAYNQVRAGMMALADHELQGLVQDIERELEVRAEARRVQAEERIRVRAQLRRDRMYDEWYPKYKLRRERKDADWEEDQEDKMDRRSGRNRFGTSDEDSDDSDIAVRYMSYDHEFDDDESAYGDDEFGDDDEDEYDEERDGYYSDSEPPVYTEYYLQYRFDYERRHPRKYARTLNEGEMIRTRISARIPISDSESESSGVTATGSSTDDSELGGIGGWDE